MTKQFREAQIRFEKQLQFYMDKTSILSIRFARSDFNDYAASKLVNMELRMKRELNRTFELTRPIKEGENENRNSKN